MDEKKKETMEESAVLDGALLAKMATGGAAELRANADTVNNLNVFPVPDGDTGDNMRMTIENGVAALAGRARQLRRDSFPVLQRDGKGL